MNDYVRGPNDEIVNFDIIALSEFITENKIKNLKNYNLTISTGETDYLGQEIFIGDFVRCRDYPHYDFTGTVTQEFRVTDGMHSVLMIPIQIEV